MPFYRDAVRAQAKDAYAAIYRTELVLDSLIDLANSQGHEISDVESLYQFSQMARIPTHLSLGKNKGKVITDLAASFEGTGYIKWRLKQNEPPRDCRRLNFLREYDNENTKLYP